MEYDYEIYQIVLVQSVWRRKLVVRKTMHIFSLVTKIQAFARGVLVRRYMSQMLPNAARSEMPSAPSRPGKSATGIEKQLHVLSSHKRAKARRTRSPPASSTYPPTLKVANICAIIIQTYWRSYVCRICFFQSLADVVVVQSVVRRWLTWRRLAQAFDNREVREQQTSNYPHALTGGRSAHFVKLESLDSGNESVSAAGKKRQTSVPFRILSEEDVEQAPIPRQPSIPSHQKRPFQQTDPRIQRERQNDQQACSNGHFDDPSRFGGSRDVWSRSGATKAVLHKQSHLHGSGRPDNGGHEHAAPASRRIGSQGHIGGTSSLSHQRTLSSEQYARSKGWNAQEEIDKEGTRKLMNQWKQKDMVNSWKIEKPKPGR